MGRNKEQTLEQLIEQADERIRTLRGLQGDLKALMQQAKEELRKSVEEHIQNAVDPSIEAHNREMERMHTESVRALAKTNSNAWRAIGRAAFGSKPDPATIGAVLCLVSRAVHEIGRTEILNTTPEDVVASISAMILGTPSAFEAYNEKTFEPFCHEHGGTPPHASVQDKPQNVV